MIALSDIYLQSWVFYAFLMPEREREREKESMSKLMCIATPK